MLDPAGKLKMPKLTQITQIYIDKNSKGKQERYAIKIKEIIPDMES